MEFDLWRAGYKAREVSAEFFDLLYATPSRDRRASYRVFEFYLTAYLPGGWNGGTLLRKYAFVSSDVFTGGDPDNDVRLHEWKLNVACSWLLYPWIGIE